MRGDPPVARPDAAAGARSALGSGALRGLALMFVSTFFFAAMHASIRHLSATIPFEIAFFRSWFTLVIVAPWFCRRSRVVMVKTDHLRHLRPACWLALILRTFVQG